MGDGGGDGSGGDGSGGDGAGGGGDTGGYYLPQEDLSSMYTAAPVSPMAAGSSLDDIDNLRRKIMGPQSFGGNTGEGNSGLSQMYQDWNTGSTNAMPSSVSRPSNFDNGYYGKFGSYDAMRSWGGMNINDPYNTLTPSGTESGRPQYQMPNFGDMGYNTGDGFLQSIGWQGGDPYQNLNGSGENGASPLGPGGVPITNPYQTSGFADWANNKGLNFQVGGAPEGETAAYLRALDPTGKQVGSEYRAAYDDDSAFGTTASILGVLAGGVAAGGLAVGAGATAGGATAGAAAGAGAGFAGGLAQSADVGTGLKGAATGAVTGGVAGGISGLNPAGYAGVTDPTYARAINGATSGAATSALQGQNPLMGAIKGGSGPLINASGNYLVDQGATKLGDMYDNNSNQTGGYSPAPYQPSPFDSITQSSSPQPQGGSGMLQNALSGMPSMQQPQKDENQSGNPIMDNVRSFMQTAGQGARESGINFQNVGSNLLDMYNRHKQNQAQGALAGNLASMYGPNSPYAQQMAKVLQRHDAASGRNSQIGARQVELQARLAEANSKNAPLLNTLYQQQAGNRNGMMGDAYRMLAGGSNGGGIIGAGQKYFNRPAAPSRNPASEFNYQNGSDIGGSPYAPPPVPFSPFAGAMDDYGQPLADGGQPRREPVVGSRGPVRSSGSGPMDLGAIMSARPASAPASGPNTYVDPMNPRSVNDYREKVQGLAFGGPVRGPGGPRDDLIPARLSNQEHVMDAHSVTALGGGSNERGQQRLNALRAKLHGK